MMYKKGMRDFVVPLISVSPPYYDDGPESPTGLVRTGSSTSLCSRSSSLYLPSSAVSPTMTPCDDHMSTGSEYPTHQRTRKLSIVSNNSNYLTVDHQLPSTPVFGPSSLVERKLSMTSIHSSNFLTAESSYPGTPTSAPSSGISEPDSDKASSTKSGSSDRISTPWARKLTVSEGISLGDEIKAVGTFLKPLHTEAARSAALRQLLQQYVSQYCAHSTVKFIGSVAIGVALPTSATDLVIEGWAADPQYVSNIATHLTAEGYPAKVVSPTEMEVDGGRVVFEAGVSSERKLVHMLKRRLDRMGGSVRSATLTLRMILHQSNLDGKEKGGLTGIALSLMMVAIAEKLEKKHSGMPSDEFAAKLLATSLKTYSKWNWSNPITMEKSAPPVVEDLKASQPAKKNKREKRAIVVSPFDGKNQSKECVKSVQIAAIFQYVALALDKWTVPATTEIDRLSRGVTPLSSVIAHKELWSRTQIIRLADSQPPQLSLRPPSPGLPNSSYLPSACFDPPPSPSMCSSRSDLSDIE
eukprot:TRINITY_DN4167_c0_g2_i1.p1 TRINITY_DN4167_c0_g2~~TRINITY_DN4167_c0_g2_i1.p1  ORF type:complete len:525 (+),score=86.27 TRINITY_DN4167_c0_g2_i1:54-1628(+)